VIVLRANNIARTHTISNWQTAIFNASLWWKLHEAVHIPILQFHSGLLALHKIFDVKKPGVMMKSGFS
jgi:hypothetical protein